jgi:flagellar biosynthetic protein FliQ
MDTGMAISILRGGVLQLLIVAAPILLIGLGVGLIISILQATTSIQEQTITFVPKIAAILLALIFFGPWILEQVVEYTRTLIELIPTMR